MSDPGLDAGRAVAVNRLALGSPIQTLLQLWKVFGRLILFSGLDQRDHLLLGVPGGLQEGSVDFAPAQGGTGLFGGGSGVGHSRKACPSRAALVNP